VKRRNKQSSGSLEITSHSVLKEETAIRGDQRGTDIDLLRSSGTMGA
jgi:hypothetical protein